MSRPVRWGAAAGATLILTLGTAVGVSAHEHRTIASGAYVMRVGWSAEPTFTGVRNAVQLFLGDGQNHPVTDLGGSLEVQVLYQGARSDELALVPAFGATYGTQGEYDAPVTPTRPGNYTFHFTGTIHGTPVDESFTSSSTTFDTVGDSTAIEFPVKDPSLGALSTGLQRLGTRLTGQITTAQTTAQNAGDAGTRATVLGAIALLLAVLLGAVTVRARVVTGRWMPVPARKSQAEG
jgi:hypothetical protein